MMVLKYFLLLLGICGLCASEPLACAMSNLYGRTSPYPVMSEISTLPAGTKTYSLSIPDGNQVCAQRGYSRFVGEIVKGCDYDYPPTVHIINNDPSSAIVSRNGNLQQDGSAQVIFYCDY